MIPKTVWTGRTVLHKEKNFMITKLVGYNTIGCQCYSDCDCQKDNKTGSITLFRVSGKGQRDRIAKPFDFLSLADAQERIAQLHLHN